jgi:hypothetical protein
MAMNAPHWHLAINHLPVMGLFLVLLLLGYALVRGRGELYGVCLGALIFLALATVPVFLTGRSADEAMMDIAEVDDKVVHIHEAAANLAFIGIGVLGVIVLAVLWMGRKMPHISRGAAAFVLVVTLAEAFLMGRAANLGGNIRHPEIRGGQPKTEEPAAKAEPK